jgi:hypothetical protein
LVVDTGDGEAVLKDADFDETIESGLGDLL